IDVLSNRDAALRRGINVIWCQCRRLDDAARRFLGQSQQIAPIGGLAIFRGKAVQMRVVDEALGEWDFLGTPDQKALPVLGRADELRRLQQRVGTSGVERREAATEFLDVQPTDLKITAVDIGDLQLAARGWAQSGGDIENSIVIEIESRDRPVRYEMARFFDNLDGLSGVVELDDPVLARLAHIIGEYGRPIATIARACELLAQTIAVKNVVTEDQRDVIVADKFASEDERVGKADRLVLHDVTQRNSPGRAVAEQAAVERQVIRRRDQKNISDSGQHQDGKRVVDHRLVIDWQQLLVDGQRRRIEA